MISFIDHGAVVWFAKSVDLIYLLVMAVSALVYALWPSKKAEFDAAANAILLNEERP